MDRRSMAGVTELDTAKKDSRKIRGINHQGVIGHAMSAGVGELGRKDSNLQIPVPKTGDCTIRLLPKDLNLRVY